MKTCETKATQCRHGSRQVDESKLRRCLSMVFTISGLLLGAEGAFGEEPDAVVPPTLVESVAAEISFEALAELPETGTVAARLHIDSTGQVTAVEIVDATHPALVGPATTAMAAFRFEPATRGGSPIDSIVVYKYRFDLKGGSLPPKEMIDTERTPPSPLPDTPAVEANASPVERADTSSSESTPYETVVREDRTYEGVTEKRLPRSKIQRIPGIHGDPVLAVQAFPGVAKSPAMLGSLFIRGSHDADSLSLVDSLPVPTVFHFGAFNTIINSDLVEDVSFLPGNFSVRYGRGTGGVVDLHTRPPKRDRLHAYLDVDLWDASVFAEGPITERWALVGSFRRSYIDGILEATHLLEDQLQLTVAPRYYDFQLKADYRRDRRDKLSIFVFGSDDKVRFGEGVLDDTAAFSRELFTRTYFYMAGISWQHRFHPGLRNDFSFRSGFLHLKGEGDTVSTKRHSVPFYLRNELAISVRPELVLRLGIDTGVGRHHLEVQEKYVAETFEKTSFEGHPGGYAELELLAIPKTSLLYGIRVDYDSLSENVDADPRFEVKYMPVKYTAIKAGLGLFHQAPPLYQSIRREASIRLKSMSAVHYSVSVDQGLPQYDRLNLSIGGFYKDLRRTTYTHTGTGRAMGMELMLNHRPSRYFFGWVSYTLMKSERYWWKETKPTPFAFDQTHVLTVVAGVSLKHDISVGLRFRLAGGFPYTPIVGTRYYEGYLGTTSVVWGEKYSDRMPLFHQLDLRVDKVFKWDPISLSIYIDVQNVYNRQNTLVYVYSDHGMVKKTVYDLPILPSLGFKVTY